MLGLCFVVNDGRAALLTDINAEAQVAFLLDPVCPKCRCCCVRSEENRGALGRRGRPAPPSAQGPGPVRSPASLCMALRPGHGSRCRSASLLYASFAISLLTILPPLLVTQVVDKVITHRPYSTLFLTAPCSRLWSLAKSCSAMRDASSSWWSAFRTDAKLNFHLD